jgi:GWxTD domain-containing protein
MKSTILAYEQPLIHAVGWSLLHFLWQGAIVALLLTSALRLLRNRSSHLRYAAACCALVLMAASPLVTFGWFAVNSSAAGQTFSHPIAEKNQMLIPRNDLGGPSIPWVNRLAESFDRSLPWVLAAWFTGTTFLLCRLNIGLIVARRMKSIAVQPVGIELQRLFHNLRRRLGVVRSVSLMNSALVQVPTVIGWLRPAVLLPVECLTGLSTIQIEAIFAHELAHIRRHDYLVSVFQSIVEAVLFYHPAVWWVSEQVRREREDCCDDLAVEISGDSLAYAKALSFLEERRGSSPAVALGANGGVLAMRIKRLLGYKEPPAYSWLTAATLCALVAAAAALCIGTFARAQTNPDNQSSMKSGGASHSTDAQYQHWVDEDVLWIIAPEERAAFLKLSTDEDRDEFIRQFWQRRDAGATGGDNVRAEHYRRLAYANQHFSAGVPGWKTDRGRIYIMYGPPNSIEAHSVGVAEPYEVWHYREIKEFGPAEQEQGTPNYKTTIVTRNDVDVKFVDACHCGEFQLQPARNK